MPNQTSKSPSSLIYGLLDLMFLSWRLFTSISPYNSTPNSNHFRVNKSLRGERGQFGCGLSGSRATWILLLQNIARYTAMILPTLIKRSQLLKISSTCSQNFFHKFDTSEYFDGTPLKKLNCLNRAAEYVQLTEEIEKRFMAIVKKPLCILIYVISERY